MIKIMIIPLENIIFPILFQNWPDPPSLPSVNRQTDRQ